MPKQQRLMLQEGRLSDSSTRLLDCIFSGLLRLQSVREMLYVAGVNLYYDVVDPMELALDAKRRTRTIDFLRSEVGRYDEAVEVVPPARR